MATKKAPTEEAPAPKKKAAKAKPRAKVAAKPPMIQKVAFTLFQVSDPKRARAFYEKTLGLARGLASPDGTWTEYDLPGGGCLALFHHPDPSARASGGSASIALEVSDLDALNRRLSKLGVKYQGDMVHGPHCRMSNILDSEGNAIILHQLSR
jgi:predicted enzyme related to lactoylglutathione lyase